MSRAAAGAARVVAVSCSARHGVDKPNVPAIRLVAGFGALGDAHFGATVQHRSRVARDPTQPNLRQVHLLHAELLDELAEGGFATRPGLLGENVTTRGVDLLALPARSRLQLGDEAVVELTGLRNPCLQLDGIAPGLMQAVLARAPSGELVRKAGVMAIVVVGGEVRAGDEIRLRATGAANEPLAPV